MTSRLRIAALAFACLGLQLAQPALAAPPPAEVFFKDTDVTEAVLSPSGRRLPITSAKGTPRAALLGFGVVKNQVDFMERMAAFLAMHLQP